MIKIDTGVPTPNFTANYGRNRKYPWHEMGVGDSFLTEHGPRKASTVKSAVWKANRDFKDEGRKYQLALDEKANRYRVWRTA